MQYLPATTAELATLSKPKLLERCAELQNAFVENQTSIPGQPKYMQTADGFMMWQEKEITLSRDDKTIEAVGGSVGNIISALGWDHINEILRVSIYNDTNNVKKIVENGIHKGVIVRGAAVGSIGGIPSVTTLSLEFNFYEMFLSELAGLSGRPFAIMGIKTAKPTGTNPWVFYQIEGPTGIWVDVSHQDVIKKFKTLMNRRKWPDRLAFAFLKRNLIRKYAGGISQKCKNFTRKLIVKGWYYPISKDRMERIALSALKGKQLNGEIEYKTIEAETEVISTPEDAEAVETELVDTTTGEVVQTAGTAEPTQPKKPVEKVEEKSPELEVELKKAEKGWAFLTKESKQELKKAFPSRLSTYQIEEVKKINKLINELATKQAA